MRIMFIALMIVAGSFVSVGIASGGETDLKAYYEDYLIMKVHNCKQAADLFDVCYNSRMSQWKKMREEQTFFYGNKRAELIKLMLSNNIGMETSRIDCFLIDQFKAWKHAGKEI